MPGLLRLGLCIVFLVRVIDCCEYKYEDISKHENFHLLPNDECGESESDRIIGGQTAAMGQFPFMAHLGYATPNCPTDVQFKCGGALITERHVLTAAHCVADVPTEYCKCSDSIEELEITFVRLGEYNIKTDPDCDGDVCADKPQDIMVKKIIVHGYFGKPRLRHDIAIIHLDKPAEFTTWVAPICLIHGDYVNKNYTGTKATVAGWGIINTETHDTSDELQLLRLPIVKSELCQETFSRITNVSNIQQMCAGGNQGQDSCSGDSGGPLFITDDTEEGPRFKAIGIVSFGFTICAKRPLPAVYTNLLYYGEWILDNLL